MSQDTVSTLRRFFELVGSGDMQTALDLMHPSCVVSEAAGLPYGGDYVGPQGFVELFAVIARDFDLKVTSCRVRDAEDVVVAEMGASVQAKQTNDRIDTSIIEFYRFTDGKISGIDVYYKDTKAVADLLAGVTNGDARAAG